MDQRELGIRTSRLRDLGYASYEAYIDGPEWRQTRARYWRSNLPKSCICGATDDLFLHHKTYVRLGAEWLDDLQPLCKPCHHIVHSLSRRGDIALDGASGLVSPEQAATNTAERNKRDALRAPEQAEVRSERAKKQARARASSLREMERRAQNRSVDVAEELAAIDAALDAMSAKLSTPAGTLV